MYFNFQLLILIKSALIERYNLQNVYMLLYAETI